MADTTRRDLFKIAGGLGAGALVAACGARPAPSAGPTTAPAGDLLAVGTAAGLGVYDAASGKALIDPATALATRDGRRLVTVTVAAAGTRLVTRDPGAAGTVAEANLRGRLTPRAVSTDAQLVALVEDDTPGTGTYRPAGRDRTTVVIAGPAGERARFTVAGCVEPEAFAPDGSALFVLDYVPPTAPDAYRVRALDLTTGTVQALLTRLKGVVPTEAEETMRGQGRQAVYDPARKVLFTLYTHQPDHEHTRDLLNPGARDGKPDVHAFVHSLSLDNGWAVCIDLPAPFGEGDPLGHAITRAGNDLAVVDTAGGAVAILDPDDLSVSRTVRFGPSMAGAAGATFSPDGKLLLVAVDTQLLALDRGTLQVTRRWTLPSPARGIGAGAHTVYIGQSGAVLPVDLGTGLTGSPVSIAGLSNLDQVTARTK